MATSFCAKLAAALSPVELKIWPRWCLPAIFAISVAAHSGLLLFYDEFVYDDLYGVKNNPLVNGIVSNCGTKLEELWRCDFWGEPLASGLSHQSWRPLTTLSYRLQWQVFGARTPRPFIAVNIAIHAVCSVFVSLVAHRLLIFANMCAAQPNGRAEGSDPFMIARDPVRQQYAVSAGLIFAVHPVHIDAIATIVGRAELLWGFFFFACLLLCINTFLAIFLHHPKFKFRGFLLQHRAILWLTLTTLALMAIVSKEQGVVILISCSVAISCLAELHDGGSFYTLARIRSSRIFAGFALIATAALVALRLSFRGSSPNIPELSTPFMNTTRGDSSLYIQVLTKPWLAARHAFIVAWPLGPLCVDWQTESVPVVTSVFDFRNLQFPVVVCTLFVIVKYLNLVSVEPFRRLENAADMPDAHLGRFAAICILALGVIPFIPASGIVVQVGYMIAERVLYVPSSGFAILLPVLANKVASRLRDSRRSRKQKQIMWPLCFIVVSVFLARCINRCYDFRNCRALYEAEVAQNPGNTKMLRNLAQQTPGCEAGAKLLQRALDIRESDPHTHIAFATHLHERCGDLMRGAQHADRAVALLASHPNPLMEHIVLYNSAVIATAAFEYDKALALVESALEQFKWEPKYHILFSEVLVKMNQTDEGVAYLRRAAEDFPRSPYLLDRYALYLETYAGNPLAASDVASAAINIVEEELAENGQVDYNLYCRLLDNRGVMLAKAKKGVEAVAMHRKAVKDVCPHHMQTWLLHFNWAISCHTAGSEFYEEAEKAYKMALEESGYTKRAETNLGILYFDRGQTDGVSNAEKLMYMEKALAIFRKHDDLEANANAVVAAMKGEDKSRTGTNEEQRSLSFSITLDGENLQMKFDPSQHLSTALLPFCATRGLSLNDCFMLKKEAAASAQNIPLPTEPINAMVRILGFHAPHQARYASALRLCVDFEVLRKGGYHCMYFDYANSSSWCGAERPDRLCTGKLSATAKPGIHALRFGSRLIVNESTVDARIESNVVRFFEISEPEISVSSIRIDEKGQAFFSLAVRQFWAGQDGDVCIVFDNLPMHCTDDADESEGDPAADTSEKLAQVFTFRINLGSSMGIHEAAFMLKSVHRDVKVVAMTERVIFSREGKSEPEALALAISSPNDCTWISPSSLKEHEFGLYSQNGEDGILLHMLRQLHLGHYQVSHSPGSTFYVEFGVEDGSECNTRLLRERYGWRGLLMDGSHENERIGLRKEIITTKNINQLFEKYQIPAEFDLLVVDIDFFDFYVWQALDAKYLPRIVVIEYNAHIPSNEARVVKLHDEGLQKWDTITNYFGASLLALTKLARRKGYELVYCESHGVNAFFVRRDILRGAGCSPEDQFDVASIYRKPNFFGFGWKYRDLHTENHSAWLYV